MNAVKSPRVRARTRKHRCYELAFKGMLASPEWTLVHGTIQAVPWADLLIGHAWLEHDGQVYDAVEDKFYSVADYQRIWSAQVTRRYTLKEACTLAEKWYGPWD